MNHTATLGAGNIRHQTVISKRKNLAVATLLALSSLIVLSACTSEDGGVAAGSARGIQGTFLSVSYNSKELGSDGLYYATQSVGSRTSSTVRILNQGADYYTLQNFAITGANADEFSTQILGDMVLAPAQVLNLDIAFQPITGGEKSAAFTLDFDTIKQVEESVSSLEQVYYEAQDLLDDGQYSSATLKYDEYLQGGPETVNKTRAAMRLPMIAEARTYDASHELDVFMDAMQLRDEQQYEQAIRKLNIFTTLYPQSHLADDAVYLKGYIQLQDLAQHSQALSSMQTLRAAHPDTTYYDTSLYSEAMAELELGNEANAERILVSLKKRHTGVDILGLQLPKDTLLSRLWFKRAKTALKTV